MLTALEPTQNSAGSPQQSLPLVLHTRVVTGAGGGPDKTILNSPRFLSEHGYDSACAYLRPPGDVGFATIAERADTANASLIPLDDRGPLDWRVYRQLKQLCREKNVAIWHGHDYKTNLFGLLLRRSHPMRLVTTVHGWGVQGGIKRALYYRIDKSSLKRHDRVICVSDDLYEECLRIGVKPERLTLIHNAIDELVSRRVMPPTDARAKLGFPADRLLIGAVGRLSAEKGFDRLITAVDVLVKEGLDIGLIIVGDGDQRSRLESLISERGLADRVRLLGHRTDVGDLYQAMDVFALSSLREGLPNVVLEAMAYETPVVATRVAGVPQLIQDGINGRLVDIDVVEQLAARIRELATQPELRDAFAAAARKTIETEFSFRVRMQKVAAIYDELLSE